MKQILLIFMLIFSLSSCASSPKVNIVSEDDYEITKQIMTNEHNKYSTIAETLTYIQMQPDDFVEQFNELCSADKIPELRAEYGASGYMVDNDNRNIITIYPGGRDKNYIFHVDYKLTGSTTPEEAEYLGKYISYGIKIFCEPYYDTIVDELDIFEESDDTRTRVVICDNLTFTYNGIWLKINPVKIDTNNKSYRPVKPE